MNDDFKQFNYFDIENIKIYGQIEPPRVPLQDLKVPVALVQGSSDRIANQLDVEWLYC